jgi:fermentation-respiration switch protein FrsA (DUF1100 family)
MTMILITEACAMVHAKNAEPDLESSVCGVLREPLAFWQFRRVAGAPDASRIRSIRDIERLSFTARDGRVLGGYLLRAATHSDREAGPAGASPTEGTGNPRGYLLVAQGNAMLADQIMGALAFFRDTGLDVYVYDYRGYGLSGGKSRLKAIVSDYREIVAALNGKGYGRRYLYGMSMGGVILTNAAGPGGEYDALVVDSSPSRISHLGCPEEYDPVRNLPRDSSKLMVLIGLRDRVVPPREIEEMAKVVQERGGLVRKFPEFAHPLMDFDPTTRRRRFQAVVDFLK